MFSGTTNQPGIRLVTQEGKQLFVLDGMAKNAYLSSANQNATLFWEQNQENNISKIAYRKVNKDKISETLWINDSANGINPTALVLNNQIVVAFEIKQANKKNTIRVEIISLGI